MLRAPALMAAVILACSGSARGANVAAELHGRWVGSCSSFGALSSSSGNYTCITERITTPYEITYTATTVAYKTTPASVTIDGVVYSFPSENAEVDSVSQTGNSISHSNTCFYVSVAGGVMTEIGKIGLPGGNYVQWDCNQPPADTSSQSSCSANQNYYYTCTLNRASGASGAAATSVMLLAFAAMIAVASSSMIA